MKNILRFACFFIFLASSAFAAAQNTYISCDKSVHNFGIVAEDGGNVTHQFLLINKGKESFKISGVSTSCGCTTSEYSKEDIAVGDTARVKVNFNPKNRPGTFMKLVRVYTNNSNNPYMLSIRGVVKKSEKKSGDE
jgi:hypothetical protein